MPQRCVSIQDLNQPPNFKNEAGYCTYLKKSKTLTLQNPPSKKAGDFWSPYPIAAKCDVQVHKIPFISVVRDAGRLVSMDNRRLYTFRMAFDDDHQAGTVGSTICWGLRSAA